MWEPSASSIHYNFMVLQSDHTGMCEQSLNSYQNKASE